MCELVKANRGRDRRESEFHADNSVQGELGGLIASKASDGNCANPNITETSAPEVFSSRVGPFGHSRPTI